jgi:hypothetical protein
MLTYLKKSHDEATLAQSCVPPWPKHFMPSPARNVTPKHLRVADLLERDIRQLPPGAPIMPVTALIKRFGVSQGTGAGPLVVPVQLLVDSGERGQQLRFSSRKEWGIALRRPRD